MFCYIQLFLVKLSLSFISKKLYFIFFNQQTSFYLFICYHSSNISKTADLTPILELGNKETNSLQDIELTNEDNYLFNSL